MTGQPVGVARRATHRFIHTLNWARGINLDRNKTTVELLAPVGTWEVLEAVIKAGADAVYLGGKKHNMRMFRSDFNFTNEDLAKAVEYAHARGVKVFVTANNLMTDAELADLRPYLQFLETIQPDSLIVQDLGVVHLARRLGLTIPLHASVMANTLNADTVRELSKWGVTRVVLGREVPFSEARRLRDETGLEMEYFIHGDMCLAQSGQCYASGMLLGESSNRGRCMKPCRWAYQLVDGLTGQELETRADGPYLLAIKDMCLLGHIPQLIESGIYSFKIEGRMRTADYLTSIVSAYRAAIDRYLADPAGYRLEPADWQRLYDNRARDFSTCYAFKHPGAAALGYTGEREPKFFSTGVREAVIGEADLQPAALGPAEEDGAQPAADQAPILAVRVGDLEAVEPAAAAGADVIYVGGEEFRRVHNGANGVARTPWNRQTLADAVRTGRRSGARVIVAAPRIAMRDEMAALAALCKLIAEIEPDGLLVSTLGQIRLARELTDAPLYGDFGLNVLNKENVRLLQESGLQRVTAQLEASFKQVAQLAAGSPLPVEAVVHGPLPGMVLEHCLPAALLCGTTREEACARPCEARLFDLVDLHGQRRPVRIDQHCRNHVYLANEAAMLPYLGRFVAAGLGAFRIEGQLYDPETLATVVRLYARNIKRAAADPAGYRVPLADWRQLVEVSPRPLGFGGYVRGVTATGQE